MRPCASLALARPSVDPEAWQQMRAAIRESLPELIPEPVADLLAPLPQDRVSTP